MNFDIGSFAVGILAGAVLAVIYASMKRSIRRIVMFKHERRTVTVAKAQDLVRDGWGIVLLGNEWLYPALAVPSAHLNDGLATWFEVAMLVDRRWLSESQASVLFPRVTVFRRESFI